MDDDLPAVHLARPHEIQLRSRILDGGKLREVTSTARVAGTSRAWEIYTRWNGRPKVIKLRPDDLAAVTDPYE
jgi:hypothetical protein